MLQITSEFLRKRELPSPSIATLHARRAIRVATPDDLAHILAQMLWLRARLRCEYEAAIANTEADAERTAEELKQMLIELNAKDQERKADRREKTAAQSTAEHVPAAA